jgi:hypothetical protein
MHTSSGSRAACSPISLRADLSSCGTRWDSSATSNKSWGVFSFGWSLRTALHPQTLDGRIAIPDHLQPGNLGQPHALGAFTEFSIPLIHRLRD